MNLQIYRTDPLSKQICESCLIKINSLYKFKKTAQETAEKQKEKLKSCIVSTNEEVPLPIRLFLACGDEVVRYLFFEIIIIEKL